MVPMGWTRDLAERARALRLDVVPEAAVAVAKATLLDTLGVALAGRSERAVRGVEDFVAEDRGEGPARVWGTPVRRGAASAALINGTAAHALDYDDVCWAMNAHPSAVLWPTALAVGDSIDAAGADVLLAYVAGFEAAADVGWWLGKEHYAAGFHPTATIGAIAATVTAGKLLRLDGSALRRALGIACSRVAGTRLNFGTDTKPLHAGFAAETGIVATSLAKRGVTAREDAIEGPMGLVALYGGELRGGSRSGFALLDPGVELKPYPSCRFTNRIIDATLAIRERHPSKRAASITCMVDPFSKSVVIYPRPSTALEGKFSMEYAAAVAWLDGRVDVDAFTDDRVTRADVRDLVPRVVVETGKAESETVRVDFFDGDADTETVRLARGSPGRPMSDAERFAKFRACASTLIGAGVEEVRALSQGLETMTKIRDFTALFGRSV